jgi:hypothetical protein
MLRRITGVTFGRLAITVATNRMAIGVAVAMAHGLGALLRTQILFTAAIALSPFLAAAAGGARLRGAGSRDHAALPRQGGGGGA